VVKRPFLSVQKNFRGSLFFQEKLFYVFFGGEGMPYPPRNRYRVAPFSRTPPSRLLLSVSLFYQVCICSISGRILAFMLHRLKRPTRNPGACDIGGNLEHTRCPEKAAMKPTRS
jgi:hypothetical protein